MELKTLHILIVDDDPNLLATMRDILKAKGFEPVLVKTAAAALAQAGAGDFDVALIDLQLEDMSGLELLRQLKTGSPATECILLTGHASQGSAIAAINAGAYSYFQKPCDVDQLVLSIQRAGEKRAAGQALRISEAFLQAVLQSTADGILAVNAENKVQYANQRFAMLWHIPPDVLASQEDAVLLQYVLDQLVDPQGFLKQVQKLYQSKEDSLDTLDFKDGRVFERLSRPLIKEGELHGRVWSFRDITERNRMEAKLEDERTLLRTLIDNLPDRVYVKDVQGHKIISNMADWQASGGKTMEDVIGKTDLETYPPELAQDYWAVDKAVIDSGTPTLNHEEPGLDSHGYPVQVLSSKLPLRDGQGKIVGLVGIGRDITGRKQAEEALRASEERYRMLAENMTDTIWLMGLDLKTTYISPSVTRLRGYTLNELNTIPLDQQMAPESFARVVKMFTTELSAERLAQIDKTISATLELELYRKDGSSFWSENRYSLIRDPHGQPLAILGFGRDITESKKARTDLENSEKRFRALIENNTDAVILVDPRGRVLYESPAYGRLTGRDSQERLGRSSFENIHPEDRPAIVRMLYELVHFPGRSAQATFRNQHKDGSWRWFEATATNLLGESAVHAVVINLHDITERKHAEEKIRQHVNELEVLYEAGLSISRLLEPKEIGQKVIDVLVEKLSWYHAFIRLYQPETGHLELLVYYRPGLNPPELQAEVQRLNKVIAKPGQGCSGWVVQHDQSIRSGDIKADPRYLETFKGIRSGLYVPMQVGGRTIGMIGVESEQPEAFSEADERLLKTLAAQAGIAIENGRLFAETQKRLHNLAALHEIETAISASVDIHVTLDILLEQTVSALNVDAAAVLLLNPLSRTLEYAASLGFQNHQVKGLQIPLGAGLAGQAAARRQIQSISDLRDGPPPPEVQKSPIDLYDGEGFVTQHAIPLSAKGQVQGVLEVFHRSPFQPDEEWFTFLETLSRQAAIAIDNNGLFDNLQRSNTNIVLAYDATIQGWSQALELRDKETEGHAHRVTERTMQLAQLVGVPAAELEHIRRGTLLHDIGKMGIPDAILFKPGKLSEAEWVIMRRHPVFAYEMLSSISYLRPALDIPHYHHERWDGTGYPEGLKGEQIPLYARIFAVVDVYDALTNDRSYRPAWTSVQAVKHIRAEAGKHFDPAIVEAFLNMLAREK